MWNSFQQKEDLRAVYRLKGCGAGEITRSAAIGVALWGALQVAETARQGESARAERASGLKWHVKCPDLCRVPPAGFAGGGQSLVAIPTDAAGAVLTGSSLPSLLLCAGLLGPLAEELLFRGYLLTALQVRPILLAHVSPPHMRPTPCRLHVPLPVRAVFADPAGQMGRGGRERFHLCAATPRPRQFPALYPAGYGGGLAAWETGSVLPALAVHAGHNLAAIASLAAVQ